MTSLNQEESRRSGPTSEVLLSTLRQEIIQNELKPGDWLRQESVAARFGVSQSVAREAFRELVREGFLVSLPRRGVSVAVMSAQEADEITKLRSRLEAQALEWAIENITATQLDGAERVLKQLDRARGGNNVIDLNAKFHRALYAPCNRERTLAMIDTLRLGFERYLRFTWEKTSHREQSQREHWELLKLCRAHKVQTACELLQEHISSTGRVLVECLSR